MHRPRRPHRTPKLLLAGLMTFFSTLLVCAADVSDVARKQGLAKAAEIVNSSGIACTVTDARRVPDRTAANSDAGQRTRPSASPSDGGGHSSISGASAGGAASQTFTLELDYGAGAGFAGAAAEEYEVACREGLGYVIGTASWKKSSAYLCIEALSAPGGGARPLTPCVLAGNGESTQTQAVNDYIAKSGIRCEATRVRGIGHTAQSTLIEAACSNGDGYVLQASNPLNLEQPVRAVNCMGLAPSPQVSCRLTDAAAQLAAAETLLGQAHPDCRVTARRYVGTSTKGGHFFEFMCRNGKGYMLKQGPAGEMAGAVACADPAVASLGGCKLVSTTS
jgi:hypothetical protein